MELVGTEVKKTFEGFGTFAGVVRSYDATTGYFRIQYEDGDSEEVDHEEISSILGAMGVPSPISPDHNRRSGRGRPPKKRRKMGTDWAAGGESGSDSENFRVEGGNIETLATENGASRVLEDAETNGGPLADVKMEEMELGDEQGRKRGSLSTPDMPVRRSARRPSAVLPSTPDPVPLENVSVSEDTDLGGSGCFSVRDDLVIPALPPSSTDLDIDGLNVFDFFSVYTCLRSFSRLLFLSPFTVEAFVQALRCKDTNFLIDSVHYSILQALRPHMEFLSEEGSESAVNCLRSLNWDILDLVTWPVFLAEYLLIHASRMKLSFKLSQLKLLHIEYYEQPAGVKLEILRCLCDDVIEVEAIRLELNRRMMDYEVNIYATSVGKKRKSSAVMDPRSFLDQEVLEETNDGNSDECCLCAMDGNLICCDGCPAAFHSRCVGVAKDLLPEGEWYCPECIVEKGGKMVKLSKPFRGAEVLGIDPHGRLYFATCDRLLVSGSCESDASYYYYNKSDLASVMNVMKSAFASYSAIINSISMYWGIHLADEYGNNNHIVHDGLDAQLQFEPLLPAKQDNDGNVEKEELRNSATPEQFGAKNSELPNLELLDPMSSHQFGDCPFACSDTFDEKVHATTFAQMSELTGTNYCMKSDAPSEGTISSRQTELAVGSGKFLELTGLSCKSLASDRNKRDASHLHSDSGSYLNYYSLGRIAFSIGKELMHSLSENKNNEPEKTGQDIRSAQLKLISKISIKCCRYTDGNLVTYAQKENCGWCVCCRTSTDEDCLFKVAYDKSREGFKDKNLAVGGSSTLGLCSENNKQSHIAFAIFHMLLIEDRVRGLMSGPWEKPHYSDNWREAVSKVSDAASLKPLLLSLESNLRRIALSVDWSKPVDYPCTIGSGSILMSTPVRASSNFGSSRKQAKKMSSGDEFSSISNAAKSSAIYWWRGGKLARQVFQLKMLPRQLASKGGRQAGCTKIPNISYSEGSEFAKRSKYVAWRAAVEMSQSVAQLIYQVQEFDANIKWMELSETGLFPQAVSNKVARLWKKVIIRRKCTEGTLVKYLLDFGKKETLPAVVTKHGVLLEESSSGRKRYWLNEILVPINILKSYEERKIARSLKRIDLGTHSENGSKCEMKGKKDRPKGFSYLMSRIQKFATELCGHCNKDVLVREAVNCQACMGFFHRKHFRVPKGATVTNFTCCRCKDKNSLNVKPDDLEEVLKRTKVSKGKKSQDIQNNDKRILVRSNKKSTQDIPKNDKHILVKSNKESAEDIQKNDKRILVKSNKKSTQDIPNNDKRILVKINKKSTEVIPKIGKLILVFNNKKSKLVINNKKTKLVKSKKRSSGRKKDVHGKFIKEKSENLKDENLKQGSPNTSESELSWRKRGKRGTSRKKKCVIVKKGDLKDGSLINSLSDFSWRKRKRSVMHYSYWVNGLLRTQKPVNEQQKHFREKKVLLPLQHSQDSCVKPVCCLCCEEFDSGVIYIGCQNCGDWFHGDAFYLSLENIKNVVGFKCHSCRMRSKPMCPFARGASFAETQLERRYNVRTDVLGFERQYDEEKLHGGSCENGLPVLDNEYHMEEKQRDNVLTHSVKEVVLNPKTISRHTLSAKHRNNDLDNCAHEDGSTNGHCLGEYKK